MGDLPPGSGAAKPSGMKVFPINPPKGNDEFAPDISTAKDLQNTPATDASAARAATRLFGGNRPSNPSFTQKDLTSATAAQTGASLKVKKVTYQEVAELKDAGEGSFVTPRDRSKRPI
jgi:hypothetical protein